MRVIFFVTVFLSSVSAKKNEIVQHLERHLQIDAGNPCVDAPGSLATISSFSSSRFTKDQCECSHVNELDGLNLDTEALGQPGGENPNFWTDIVVVLNDVLRGLNYDYSNACNGCQCLGNVCGVVTANEEIVVEGNPDANMTLGEILALVPQLGGIIEAGADATGDQLVEAGTSNITALVTLFGPNLFAKNIIDYCMEFNDETKYEGKVCLGIDSTQDEESTAFSTQPQLCTLTYKGQSCSNCQFEARDGKTCASADCSSVDGIGSKFDTCTGEGLDGVLQFLDVNKPYAACGTGGAVSMTDGTGAGSGALSMTYSAVAFLAVVLAFVW